MLTTAVEQLKIAIDGWKKFAVKNDDIEMLFDRRNLACSRCEHMRAFTCDLCGCPLKAKLRAVDASCPDHCW
jgi:hypothetical protein